MKLLIGFLLALSSMAYATTCTVPSGATLATIQTTLNSCGSGSTVQLPVGSWQGNITVPANTTLLGPAVSYGQLPTAKLVSTVANTAAITLGNNSVVSYLEVNGNQPSPDGGMGVYVPIGDTVVITYNYIHGNQASTTTPNWYDALIYLDGYNGAAINNNSVIEDNILGAAGDCSNVMNSMSYAGWSGNGGYCNAIGLHAGFTNLLVEYNTIAHQEQGIKVFEGQGECVNCLISNNDISNWKRFAIEAQANQGNTSMLILYNSIHTPYMPGYGTWGISAANGCPTGCVTSTDSNVIIDEVPAATGGQYVAPAIEQWGSNGTKANTNLIQGYWTGGIDTSATGQFVYNGNNFCMSVGGSTTMPGTGSPGYFEDETSNAQSFTPTGSGNTFTTATCPTTSVTPVISIASGIATITNPGLNRDLNTSIWYTIDGSTPIPGQGTAKIGESPVSVVLQPGTTIKAVGMWGTPNQPTSYPTGYGYVPSPVVQATYTAPPTITTVPCTGTLTNNAGQMSFTLSCPNL